MAQESQDTQAQTQGTDQAPQTQQAGDTGQAADGQQAQGQGDAMDALLATVGDSEIRTSDLMRAIGALPPTLSAQPPEIVASLGLQQLLLREAILQEARTQGLTEDPEVQQLVTDATQAAEEDALVQVWLERALADRVTPETVEQAYAGLRAIAGNDVPPLDQLRPQIEASLRQQAVEDIRASLLTGADITFYGPDGQPRTGQQQAENQGAGGAEERTTAGDEAENAATDQSGNAASGQAQPSQAGAGEPAATVMVTEGQEYGLYLTDAEGRALYMFTADQQGRGDAEGAVSNCYDACAEVWPPLLTQGTPESGELAMPGLLGTTLRADGSMQVTYNGWPLYHYAQDQGAGQATGQDVEGFGGEWYLVRPTGEAADHE